MIRVNKNPGRLTLNPRVTRARVNQRLIGWTRLGPVYLTLITYMDGRRSWGVSEPGGSGSVGDGAEARARVKELARLELADRVPVPEGATVYACGARWIGGRVVYGRHDGFGGWTPNPGNQPTPHN